MPWEACNRMDGRVKLLAHLLEGEIMAARFQAGRASRTSPPPDYVE